MKAGRRSGFSGLVLAVMLLCSADASAETAPIYSYCGQEGHTVDGQSCKFTDGTACELWAFFYGTCGGKWTLCEKVGGKISAGGDSYCMLKWADSCALCTLSGGTKCPAVLVTSSGGCARPADAGTGPSITSGGGGCSFSASGRPAENGASWLSLALALAVVLCRRRRLET
jgi:hypothetical protein